MVLFFFFLGIFLSYKACRLHSYNSNEIFFLFVVAKGRSVLNVPKGYRECWPSLVGHHDCMYSMIVLPGQLWVLDQCLQNDKHAYLVLKEKQIQAEGVFQLSVLSIKSKKREVNEGLGFTVIHMKWGQKKGRGMSGRGGLGLESIGMLLFVTCDQKAIPLGYLFAGQLNCLTHLFMVLL